LFCALRLQFRLQLDWQREVERGLASSGVIGAGLIQTAPPDHLGSYACDDHHRRCNSSNHRSDSDSRIATCLIRCAHVHVYFLLNISNVSSRTEHHSIAVER
jgi:hypothetical protein